LSSPLGLYVSIYYVFGGDKELASVLGGWSGMAAVAAGFAGLPIATWLAKCLGKRHAALALLLLGLLSVPLTWWMFTPENPWLQIVPGFIFGLAINGCFLIGVSMLGDVCDADELKTGHRREGIYSASLEFGKKCAIALSTIVVGYLLLAVGFGEKAAMPVRPNHHLFAHWLHDRPRSADDTCRRVCLLLSNDPSTSHGKSPPA
jgi:Na+/melibiose symporter-like transporter